MAFRTLLAAALVLCCASCGGSGDSKPAAAAPDSPPPPPVKVPLDDRPVIVAFGDSLSAGYGLETGLSYPDFLQKIIDGKGLKYHVINQGLSGDTTSGGLARIDQCVALKPKLVLLELGGNDGLRGIPVSKMRENLDTIIRKLKAADATVVLVGITLPLNYGPDYIKGFEKNYKDLAREHNLTLIPFLLDGIWTPTGAVPGMIQDDGIHPTAKGTPVMAENVFKRIEKLLR